jgi:hypothetical protein
MRKNKTVRSPNPCANTEISTLEENGQDFGLFTRTSKFERNASFFAMTKFRVNYLERFFAGFEDTTVNVVCRRVWLRRRQRDGEKGGHSALECSEIA